jgi:hypothetical protein
MFPAYHNSSTVLKLSSFLKIQKSGSATYILRNGQAFRMVELTMEKLQMPKKNAMRTNKDEKASYWTCTQDENTTTSLKRPGGGGEWSKQGH